MSKEHVQTNSLERWVGQTVYRRLHPTIGPNSYKLIGIRKGVIIDIHTAKDCVDWNRSDRPVSPNDMSSFNLHITEFEVDIDWITKEVTRPVIHEPYQRYISYNHFRIGKYYYWGLITPFEMQVILDGYLLSSKKFPIEKQTEKDKENLAGIKSLYRKVLENPSEPYFLTED